METTRTTPASKGRPSKRAPAPSGVRTNRDWVMIAIGVLLIVFFVVAGYVSLIKTNKNSPIRKRGPVKDPKKTGYIDRNSLKDRTRKAVRLAPRMSSRESKDGRNRGVV